MGIFDFVRQAIMCARITRENQVPSKVTRNVEFLIVGDVDLSVEEYDDVMTPNSVPWTKVMKGNWPYYNVGNDEYSYSFEEPGIQICFNKEIAYSKAKLIADEILANINATGHEAELILLSVDKPIAFNN